MKSRAYISVSCLTAVLLTTVVPAQAIEATADNPAAEVSDGEVSLIIGRVAKIEGQTFVVEEEGGTKVLVQVTPDTQGPKTLKVGEHVMVSLRATGVATVITGGEIAGEAESLNVGEQGAR